MATEKGVWDISDVRDKQLSGEWSYDGLKQLCEDKTITSLRTYQAEILEERERQADIKERYGVRSLEKLIADLDEDLVGLGIREHKGDDVQLAIRNKKTRYTHNAHIWNIEYIPICKIKYRNFFFKF